MTKIDLNRNAVGERGVAALAAKVNEPNCSLTDLWLESSQLDEAGALLFAAALPRNRKLRKLSLAGNRTITITGWRAIFSTGLAGQTLRAT